MQRLGAAEHGRQRLDGRSDHVVVRVLNGQADARRLTMGAQHQGTRVLRGKFLFHERRPQQPRGPQLRHLHEEIHADTEKERQAGRKTVNFESAGLRRAHVFDAVGQGEREFLHARRPGLLHVVTGNRDRIEARHVFRGVTDDIGDDSHGRLGRIDVGVPDHELLEYVVLQRAGELVLRHTLLFRGDDIHREHRQRGAVHGHGNRHLFQRDLVEEDFHVLHAVDGDARLAHVADDPRVVGVVAPVRRQVEGHRQSRLAAFEIFTVERVGFFRRRVAGVLPQSPRAPGVHGGARATDVGRESGQGVQMFESLEIVGGVQRLDVDSLRRLPDQIVERPRAEFFLRQRAPFGKRLFRGFSHGRRTPASAPRMLPRRPGTGGFRPGFCVI